MFVSSNQEEEQRRKIAEAEKAREEAAIAEQKAIEEQKEKERQALEKLKQEEEAAEALRKEQEFLAAEAARREQEELEVSIDISTHDCPVDILSALAKRRIAGATAGCGRGGSPPARRSSSRSRTSPNRALSSLLHRWTSRLHQGEAL